MKNKMMYLYAVLAVLLLVTGVIVYRAVFSAPLSQTTQNATPTPETVPQVDASVSVVLVRSKAKANTVVLTVSGLAGKYATVGYEFSYESKGLIKGVNSGSTPLDVSGKDSFDREVYLGTCSRNDCTPDLGVTKVSVVLEFTNSSGAKSQFSKDFDL